MGTEARGGPSVGAIRCILVQGFFCDSWDKVEALFLDRTPPLPHPLACLPPCLNFPLANTRSWLLLAPQQRLIVFKPPLVSREKREKAEAASLSPPLVPPDPGPIF